MRSKFLLVPCLTLLVAAPAFANLIEDGAAFTGVYETREDACATEVFDYATGKTNLDYRLTLWGTPDGLSLEGPRRSRPMQKDDVVNAKPGSGGTSREEYLSPVEYRSETALHFEHDGGIADFLTDDYKLEGANLTVTKTRLHPVGPRDNSVCHYVRVNGV